MSFSQIYFIYILKFDYMIYNTINNFISRRIFELIQITNFLQLSLTSSIIFLNLLTNFLLEQICQMQLKNLLTNINKSLILLQFNISQHHFSSGFFEIFFIFYLQANFYILFILCFFKNKSKFHLNQNLLWKFFGILYFISDLKINNFFNIFLCLKTQKFLQ